MLRCCSSEFLCFQLCDVTLKIGSDSIHAHRLVLASVSPYFHAMFNGKPFFLYSGGGGEGGGGEIGKLSHNLVPTFLWEARIKPASGRGVLCDAVLPVPVLGLAQQGRTYLRTEGNSLTGVGRLIQRYVLSYFTD